MGAEDGGHHIDVLAHVGEDFLDDFHGGGIPVFRHEGRVHRQVFDAGHRLLGLDLEDVGAAFEEQAQVGLDGAFTEFLVATEMAEEQGGGIGGIERPGEEAVDDFFLV